MSENNTCEFRSNDPDIGQRTCEIRSNDPNIGQRTCEIRSSNLRVSEKTCEIQLPSKAGFLFKSITTPYGKYKTVITSEEGTYTWVLDEKK